MWEYKVVRLLCQDAEGFYQPLDVHAIPVLNELGLQGWELVSVLPAHTMMPASAFFKRVVVPKPIVIDTSALDEKYLQRLKDELEVDTKALLDSRTEVAEDKDPYEDLDKSPLIGYPDGD